MDNDNTVSPNLNSQLQPGLENKPGGAWARFWASFIDSLVLTIPTLLLGFVISALVGSPILFRGDLLKNIENNWITGVIYLVLYFIYSVYFTVYRGGTWGKDAYGLTIVKYQTNNYVSLLQSLVRELIKVGVLFIPIIGGLIYFINGLTIVFSSEKRGIHDRLAKTQVLKTHSPWSLKKQLLIFLLILIGIIASLFLGGLLNTVINPNASKIQTSISSSPSSYQLFENTEAGYSIQYDSTKFSRPTLLDPQTRQKKGFGGDPNYITFYRVSTIPKFCLDNFIIDVEENPNRLPLKQWVNSEQILKNAETITINGVESLKVTTIDSTTNVDSAGKPRPYKLVLYLVPNGNRVYRLTYSYFIGDYPESECQSNAMALDKIFVTLKPI